MCVCVYVTVNMSVSAWKSAHAREELCADNVLQAEKQINYDSLIFQKVSDPFFLYGFLALKKN
jgi:hypothetical protein